MAPKATILLFLLFLARPVRSQCILAIGGVSTNPLSPLADMEVYNPQSNAWTTANNSLWPRVPRVFAAAVAFSPTAVLLAGGQAGYSTLNSAEIIDFNATSGGGWALVPAMPQAAALAGAGVLRGYAYVVGGIVFAGGSTPVLSTVQQYDPTANNWTLVAPLLEARGSAGVVVAEGFLWAVGGTGSSSLLASVERYDPRRNLWTPFQPSLPSAFQSLVAVALNNSLFAVGGGPVLALNIGDAAWRTLGPLPQPTLSGQGAATVGSSIYLVGGLSSGTGVRTMLGSADGARTWAVLAMMSEARAYPAVAVASFCPPPSPR